MVLRDRGGRHRDVGSVGAERRTWLKTAPPDFHRRLRGTAHLTGNTQHPLPPTAGRAFQAQLLAGQLPAAAAGPGRSPLPSELLPPRPRRNPFVAASPVPRCSSSSDSRGSGHPSRTTPFIAASPVPRRGRFYCRLALPFSAPLRSTFTHASPFPARRGF